MLVVVGERCIIKPDEAAIKSTEMSVSDIGLFKKSKIIKIGSVKKSYGLAKLEVFGGKSGNPEIFVPEIWEVGSETVRNYEHF